jgi:hypothetical protein
MPQPSGQFSPSGVLIADDFRDNLIIDRFDPVFADMRASKIKHLRSVNSEDAVTWNVFRSLRQITPAAWLPGLWRRAFPTTACPTDLNVVVKVWQSIAPPVGLLATGDEGASEIDVAIEAPTWVWFIEAKHRSDISIGTTTRPDRDQIIRNLDVGTYYAGVRQFVFSLLVSTERTSPEGVKRIAEYAALDTVRAKLRAHRPDGLENLRAVGLLTWVALAEILDEASREASREDERSYAARALSWLHDRGLAKSAIA